MKRSILLLGIAAFSATFAHASLVYTCDPSIDASVAGTCSFLNSAISGIYGNAFSNANADIYIQMGVTGLGSSTSGFLNLVTYATYRTALTTTGSNDAVDVAARASLPATEPAAFGGGNIEVTSALGAALGLTGMVGTTAGGAACFTPGVGTCYNGIITITTPANLSSESGGTQGLYFRQQGGSIPGNDYDFYTVVEHETDEVLGSSSCIDTTGGVLSNGCAGTGTNAAAVDLFRYQSPGTRVVSSTTPGAYFSYNGGVTNVATYNTLANGDDYGDFMTNCQHVQDATGCLGQSSDITSGNGAEVSILDAVGFNAKISAVPEPGTLAMLGLGFAALAGFRNRRRA